jgi:hypothetical protein
MPLHEARRKCLSAHYYLMFHRSGWDGKSAQDASRILRAAASELWKAMEEERTDGKS